MKSSLYDFDRPYHDVGPFLVGVDEVGRGPLAGPVVAAACRLPKDFYLEGIDDSKKLSAKRRAALFEELKRSPGVYFEVALATAEEIDEINIYHASRLAMMRAITALEVRLKESLQGSPSFVLVDAMALPDARWPSKSVIKGDASSLSIASASIVAKETRDNLMRELHELYPQYDLARHMGYPTTFHLEALKKYGPSPIHRKSYRPVKALFLSKGFD